MSFKISEEARKKIKEILDGDENRDKKLYLNVKVVGGGCSGFSYNLELVNEEENPIGEKDKVFEFPEIKVVIDPKSYLYLIDTTLDYIAHGLTGGFTFVNPNTKSSCGCGQSFHA